MEMVPSVASSRRVTYGNKETVDVLTVAVESLLRSLSAGFVPNAKPVNNGLVKRGAEVSIGRPEC